jgi:hypothetical protein
MADLRERGLTHFGSRFPAKKLNHLPRLRAGHLTRRFAPGGAETFAEIGIFPFWEPIPGKKAEPFAEVERRPFNAAIRSGRDGNLCRNWDFFILHAHSRHK